MHGTASATGVTYGPVGTLTNVNGVPTLNHGSDHLRRSNIVPTTQPIGQTATVAGMWPTATTRNCQMAEFRQHDVKYQQSADFAD
jgi:hypothetical protein